MNIDIYTNNRNQQSAQRVQDEIITARHIKQQHPELTWTECLKASKESWDKKPVFN